MGRLVVLVTSPRLPAGLLTASAWTSLRDASLIATADVRSRLAVALTAEGLVVESLVVEPGIAVAGALLGLATEHDLVWLAAEEGDDELMRRLAAEVVERADGGRSGPAVEVLVGSFDPVGSRLLDLVEVMDRLRAECPWDRRQTHESLVRYLVEETYETVEAIETGDRDHLREELGDLLLQVMFHARVAEEHDSDPFGIDEVAAGIVTKLIRRHPHVFPAGTGAYSERDGPSAMTVDRVQSQWDQIKAAEKSRTSVLDGIPPGLPALALAEKLLDRAGSPTASPPATPADAVPDSEQTLGDALFSLVAVAHAAGLDAEQALRLRVRQEMAKVRAREQRATPAGRHKSS